MAWPYFETHLQKSHIDWALAPKNRFSPTSSIFIPHSITHVTRLWHNLSYSSMTTTLYTYIIHSLVQKKLMILSAINILSSGKIASQMISANYHKVLVPAKKLETITYSLYQEVKYQVEEISCMLIKYATIAHRWGPAQDVPYNLILWYVSKTIYIL